MNNKENEFYVVSKNTGEIIDELSPGDKIVHFTEKEKKKLEYNKEHILNFNKEVDFVKEYTEISYILSIMLSPKECQFIMGLKKFISYEDCSLIIGYEGNKRYMNLNDISEALRIDYTRTSRLVKSLIDKGILGTITVGNINGNKKDKHYIVNPYICINGKNPDKSVVNHFNKTGWKELISKYYEKYGE